MAYEVEKCLPYIYAVDTQQAVQVGVQIGQKIMYPGDVWYNAAETPVYSLLLTDGRYSASDHPQLSAVYGVEYTATHTEDTEGIAPDTLRGLAAYGGTLYVSNRATDLILMYDISSYALVGTLNIAGVNGGLQGITRDTSNFYSVGNYSSGDILYKHSLSGTKEAEYVTGQVSLLTDICMTENHLYTLTRGGTFTQYTKALVPTGWVRELDEVLEGNASRGAEYYNGFVISASEFIYLLDDECELTERLHVNENVLQGVARDSAGYYGVPTDYNVHWLAEFIKTVATPDEEGSPFPYKYVADYIGE